MYSMIFLAAASFALSLMLTPLFRDMALRLKLVDKPDNHRKIHSRPIPRIGGVAIAASVAAAFGLLFLFRLRAGLLLSADAPFALRLLPAVAVIFCVGLVDDIFQVRPMYKLVAQIVAAILAWESGIHLSSIGMHNFPVILSFVLTIIWIVACSNAMNLIDGVDGLAAGVGLVASVTTLIAALFHHNIELAFATVPLVGALLGFLRFNFSPASVFLGDCGSLTLGFLLGCYGIVWSEKSTTLLSMVAPLIVLFVPLLDASLAIVRRFLRQQPIFSADRGHIHHKLLSQGLPPWRVALILYGFGGLAGVAGLILTAKQITYHSFVVIIVLLVAWLAIQHLGYSELSVAGRAVFGGGFHRLLNGQLNLAKFEQELMASHTIEEIWELLCRDSPEFGFSVIELRIDDEVQLRRTGRGWQIRVYFPGRGYVVLKRASGSRRWSAAGVPFIDCIERVFFKRLDELKPRESELPAYAQAD
jgi:UDP-GlcNAc:undecaprenyl-phosphate/decaprenyl-phosphate GlcNAc-1-phosphate transferase